MHTAVRSATCVKAAGTWPDSTICQQIEGRRAQTENMAKRLLSRLSHGSNSRMWDRFFRPSRRGRFMHTGGANPPGGLHKSTAPGVGLGHHVGQSLQGSGETSGEVRGREDNFLFHENVHSPAVVASCLRIPQSRSDLCQERKEIAPAGDKRTIEITHFVCVFEKSFMHHFCF